VGRYVRTIRLIDAPSNAGYPFDLPMVRHLSGLPSGFEIRAGVTFFVGENGSGKSTLIEAIAVAAGMNAEGGSQNYRFSTRATESPLGSHLLLSWEPLKPRTKFFLRAESFYNMATESERLGPEQIAELGGISPHEQSHGESFMSLMLNRFRPRGLFLLDEPEAALSPRGCMAALARLAALADQNCQIIVATHSPILLALPGATIYEVTESGSIDTVGFDDAMPVRLMRRFLASPESLLRHLV
jgi:predicted ATPase